MGKISEPVVGFIIQGPSGGSFAGWDENLTQRRGDTEKITKQDFALLKDNQRLIK